MEAAGEQEAVPMEMTPASSPAACEESSAAVDADIEPKAMDLSDPIPTAEAPAPAQADVAEEAMPQATDNSACAPAVEASASSVEPSAAAEGKKALGNAAHKANNYTEAARLYGEAIAEAGAAAPATYFSNRAVSFAALGDWKRVREDAMDALSRPASDSVKKKMLYQKARAELRMGDTSAADQTLAEASSNGWRADVEKLLQGDSLLPARSPASASQSKAPAKAPQPSTGSAGDESIDAAAKAKAAGTASYKEGNYTKALTSYKQALELLPDGDTERKAQLLGNCAAACLMLRRASECQAMCLQALELDPNNSKMRVRLSTAKAATGDFADARAALGQVDGDVTLANGLKQLEEWERSLQAADDSLKRGEPAKALAAYLDLETKALFESPALTLKVARCYLEMKNYSRTLNATQQVLRANPRNTDALVLRTEALFRNNTNAIDSKQWIEPLEQGQKLLKEVLQLDPDHTGAQTLRKRLRSLCAKHAELKAAMDSREFETARRLIDTMIEEASDNQASLARLYCERAKADIRLKDWRQVIKDVGLATYRDHELVQAYYYRAQAFQALERYEDAVKDLEGLFQWHRTQEVYEKVQDAKFQLRKSKRPNYYELLKVPTVASQPEIKKAYRERASEWHPDKKGHLDEAAQKNAEEMFKRIGEAYEVLTDSTKKDLYDKGYDLEGIEEQIEIKKRRTDGGCCGGGFR